MVRSVLFNAEGGVSMSVKQRPNGKWRARYRDEAGKEYARHFTTKREALAWEAEKRSAVAKGTHLAPAGGKKTLREYYESYKRRKEWSPHSIRAHDQAMKFCPFDQYPLRKINRATVQDWINEMRTRSKPLKPNTIRGRFATVQSTLAAATTDRLIPFNPCDGVQLPAVESAPWDIRIPTSPQVQAMLGRAEGMGLVMLATATFAGLRASEIPGLQAADVQPPLLKVRRQIRRAAHGGLEPAPPKYRSFRDVPLPPGLEALLTWQIETVGAAGTDWVFPGMTVGNPASYSFLRVQMAAATKDWPDGLRHLHALRHYYASALIAAKCDVVTVQRSLGHKNPSMTLDVYSHLWDTSFDEALSVTTSFMNTVAPQLSANSPQATGNRRELTGCRAV